MSEPAYTVHIQLRARGGQLDEVALEGLELDARRTPEGAISLLGVFAGAKGPETGEERAPETAPAPAVESAEPAQATSLITTGGAALAKKGTSRNRVEATRSCFIRQEKS